MICEKILELADSLKNEIDKKDLLDNINTCMQYLNIQMESSFAITMGDKSVSQIEMLNNKRNHAHDKMCEAMNEINYLAKEKKMEKIFNFELEPMNKNGRFAGYSQDNHYKTAGYCAIMADEMLYLGRETCKTMKEIERLEENISEKVSRRLIENLSLDQLIEKLHKFDKEHFSLDTVMKLEDNRAIEISFRDKEGSLTIEPLDDYSVQILVSSLPENSSLLDFLDTDGTGEIPKSILKEAIQEHDGYNIDGYYELEKEQIIEQNVLLEVAKEAIKNSPENIFEKEKEELAIDR